MQAATSNNRQTTEQSEKSKKRRVIVTDFFEGVGGLLKKADETRIKHNDLYLNYFGVALSHAIEGMKKVFHFPLKKSEYAKMYKKMVPDYTLRNDLFNGVVALCQANLLDFIAYASKREIEGLRLILKIATAFLKKTMMDFADCFKDAQFSLGEPRP